MMNPDKAVGELESIMNLRLLGFVAGVASLLLMPFVASAQDPSATNEPVFATVNGQTITQKTFQSTYANYMRQTYYHRQVPEGELALAQDIVKNLVIDRILLLAEAKRRGLLADEQAVARTVAEYDARYASSERWKQNRDTMLVGVKQQLAEQSLLEQIEKMGRTIPEPSEDQVRAYYTAHPELFTEPEKLRLHTILLKVDPSSPKAVWDAARVEAQRILKQIKAGTSFEDLARLHSNDGSAEQGGDMGYLHKGMIPDPVLEQIDAFKLGELTPPVDVLEGVAIFRLDERVASKLRAFDQVSPRAKDLLKRAQVDTAWADFKTALRKGADITLADPVPPGKPVITQ